MSEAVYFEAPSVADLTAQAMDQRIYDALEGHLGAYRNAAALLGGQELGEEVDTISSLYAGALGGVVRWVWDHAEAREDVVGLRDGIVRGVDSFLRQLAAQEGEG